MRVTSAILFTLLISPLACLAQVSLNENTNGDGIVDEHDEPLLPKLVASLPVDERANALVPGVYVNVAEVRGFHISYLHVKDDQFKFFLFSCGGGYSDEGATEFDLGWFKAGDSYWHPAKLNGRDLLWRADAWQLWSKQRKLYDYGILVRVDDNDPAAALKSPPSVSTLYDSKMKSEFGEWRDPFVYGPRELKQDNSAEPSRPPENAN